MIEFANPAALWFLTLIVPIVLLYLLKRRRQDRVVPSTFLWKQALEDTQASTPFQKLRSNLLLLLQILIVVLLTALLAQPFFPTPSTESRQWILVIDRSASMQATDETPNRYEAAQNKLTALIESVPSEDQILLLSTGSEASILQNFTTNHAGVLKKLNQLEVEDVAAEWEDLFLILKPLLRKSPKPKLIIASDFANIPAAMMQSLNFDSIQVGRKSNNFGITRAALESLPDSTHEQLLFFQVKNFSGSAGQADLEVRQNNELLDAFQLQLKPMEEREKTLRVSVQTQSRLEVRIQTDDAFSLDNDFILIAEPRKRITVQNDIKNAFLTRALNVLDTAQTATGAPIKISNDLQDGPGLYFLRGNNQKPVAVVQWNSAGPQLRFIDAGLWRIMNYRVLTTPPGAEPLLEISEGVVGYTLDESGKRRIVLGFQIEDSNLALLAGFPIFIGNALEWIQEGLIPKRPTQTNRDFPNEGEIDAGTSYVNFANGAESDLTPQPLRAQSVSETKAAILRRDSSEWFLLALLAIVILEWWIFHRKEFV